MTPRLICVFCERPILKRGDNFDHRFDIEGSSGIERAWHRECQENAVPADSPFQAALQKAKQAIADAHRLGETEYASFVEIVELALREQRE